MNRFSLSTYNGVFFLLIILFGCAATTTTTVPRAVSEPAMEPVPGQWVNPNSSEVKDPIEPPASLAVKGPESTDVVRYENCENSDDIVEEGPPTSEVGVAVSVEGRSKLKPAYAFSRHICKTEVHD